MKHPLTIRLHPRSYSMLESIRDRELLPSLNAAIEYAIKICYQTGTNPVSKVASAGK